MKTDLDKSVTKQQNTVINDNTALQQKTPKYTNLDILIKQMKLQGLSMREIGEKIGITLETVRYHLKKFKEIDNLDAYHEDLLELYPKAKQGVQDNLGDGKIALGYLKLVGAGHREKAAGKGKTINFNVVGSKLSINQFVRQSDDKAEISPKPTDYNETDE